MNVNASTDRKLGELPGLFDVPLVSSSATKPPRTKMSLPFPKDDLSTVGPPSRSYSQDVVIHFYRKDRINILCPRISSVLVLDPFRKSHSLTNQPRSWRKSAKASEILLCLSVLSRCPVVSRYRWRYLPTEDKDGTARFHAVPAEQLSSPEQLSFSF